MGKLDAPVVSKRSGREAWKRWSPFIVLVLASALVFAMGWHRYLSFKSIGLNYDLLRDQISEHLVVSLLVFMAIYAGVIALSLPVGVVLTIAGGLLFGWQLAVPAVVVSATAGACVVFYVVNTSFGAALARKAGPSVAKLRDGFRQNALNYLLFLRLVPVFPFFIVNLVCGLVGVPLGSFVVATALGIIPGTTAYALAGSGFGSVIEAQNATYKACVAAMGDGHGACVYDVSVRAIITPELIWAGVALGIIALIPVSLQKWGRSRANF